MKTFFYILCSIVLLLILSLLTNKGLNLAIFNSACWEFGLALGPDSNRSNHDHFHLDNGN